MKFNTGWRLRIPSIVIIICQFHSIYAFNNMSVPFSVAFHAFWNNFLQAGRILAASQNHATPSDLELDEHIYDKEVDEGNSYLLEQVLC
jgi:hypothetical protein